MLDTHNMYWWHLYHILGAFEKIFVKSKKTIFLLRVYKGISIQSQKNMMKTRKNKLLWTFLKLKNDFGTFEVSCSYFCKVLVPGYPSTTYDMVPRRLRRNLSLFIFKLGLEKLPKIKENRCILLNFSWKSLWRVNKSKKSREAYVSAMKKWFTRRITFPFVSARSPDPKEVPEYP